MPRTRARIRGLRGEAETQMQSSELRAHTSRGPHSIEGPGRWLVRGLVLEGVLACLCAGLHPFGVELQRGFEDFVPALRIARWTTLAFALPVAWLGIVWLGRVRANQPALSGDVVGPAHYLPDLSGLFSGGSMRSTLVEAKQQVEETLFEAGDSLATLTSAVERRHGKRAVRRFDVHLTLAWLIGCGFLALFALLRAFGWQASDAAPFLRVPLPLVYLAWGLGSLWTAAVVHRITRWQVLALPPRMRRAVR